jgi:hypothetical protein
MEALAVSIDYFIYRRIKIVILTVLVYAALC